MNRPLFLNIRKYLLSAYYKWKKKNYNLEPKMNANHLFKIFHGILGSISKVSICFDLISRSSMKRRNMSPCPLCCLPFTGPGIGKRIKRHGKFPQ